MGPRVVRAAVELRNEPEEPRGAGPRHCSADILGRVRGFSDTIDRVAAGVVNPLSIVIEEPLGPVEAIIDGRRTLMFGSNSYLGLNFHPACIRASTEATERYGTGSTASRVAGGNHRPHVELEQEIAAFYGARDAILYSTGYMANLGVIAGLAREGDLVLADAHSHASVIDGARLSGATLRTFAHNDGRDLERQLDAGDVAPERTIVVLEGVYSVWGDVGDLLSIIPAAKRCGATVVVDEAHSLGIYGTHGRGVVESLGLEDEVDVVVGTFSKSIGVVGGFCVTNAPALRSLRFMARPYLYTASLPPGVIAAARQSLQVMATDQALRDTLWRNARALHAGLKNLGLDLCAAPGPVGSIRMPGLRACHDFWKGLLARGVCVNVLIPPATPGGEVVLRFSVSAAHTAEHIDRALEAFAEVARSLRLN